MWVTDDALASYLMRLNAQDWIKWMNEWLSLQPQPLDIWNRTWNCYWLRFCYEFGYVPCSEVNALVHDMPNWNVSRVRNFQPKTEYNLNMHGTISTLCISISHLATKSRTIFRCIWCSATFVLSLRMWNGYVSFVVSCSYSVYAFIGTLFFFHCFKSK